MKKFLIILVSLILVGCSNKKTINYDSVKKNLNDDFKGFDVMDVSTLENNYSVEGSAFKSSLIVMDNTSTKSKMYAIFEANDDFEDAEYEADSFIKKYKEAWGLGYFPEEAKLVEDSKKEIYGNYIIYVVSKNNEDIINKIKNSTES
ncbi:MAG: DUF4358 domain-containing protein [Bacilli bacterium]